MSTTDDRDRPASEDDDRTTDVQRAGAVDDYRSSDMGSESQDDAFDELDGEGVNPPDDAAGDRDA